MPTTSKDYYKVLGVSRSASSDEIRKAFKDLARKYHPDRNKDDAEAETRFKEVNEAYQVLGDEKKRTLFDKYGDMGLRDDFDPEAYERASAGFGGGGAGGFQGGPGFGGFGGGGFSQEFDLNDLFGAFAGGGARRGGRAARPARDLRIPMQISFDEALRGTQTTFRFRRPDVCPTCGGAGMSGQGICPACGGSGTKETEATVTVNIPRGARDGDTLRLRGKGARGADGRQADLLLELSVRADPRFRREGNNLVTTVSVTPLDLLTGAQVAVQTPDGPVDLKVPAGMDPAKRLRIAERGVTRGKKTGDLLVELKVAPVKLDEQGRAIAQSLRDHLDA